MLNGVEESASLNKRCFVPKSDSGLRIKSLSYRWFTSADRLIVTKIQNQ